MFVNEVYGTKKVKNPWPKYLKTAICLCSSQSVNRTLGTYMFQNSEFKKFQIGEEAAYTVMPQHSLGQHPGIKHTNTSSAKHMKIHTNK